MEMKSGMFFKPCLHIRMFVGSIVIHNTVNIQFPRSLPVNRTDKFRETPDGGGGAYTAQ